MTLAVPHRMAGVDFFRRPVCDSCFCPAVPLKTFAQGWATPRAMDRPGDDLAVIIHRADDRVLVEKRQRLLRQRIASQ